MAKFHTKKFLSNGSINPEFLEEMKRQTLIQSTDSSLRLSGIKITEKEVEQIVNRPAPNAVFHKNIEKILSPKQSAVLEYLQNIKEAAPGEITKKTKIARPTVNQALEKLLRLKKVERFGLGRSTRYRKL